MQHLMYRYMGPAVPVEGDNTAFAPTRAIHLPPAPKMVMGYLMNVEPQKAAVKDLINDKSQEVARLRAELADLRKRKLEHAETFMNTLSYDEDEPAYELISIRKVSENCRRDNQRQSLQTS